ncbi:MAG: hypothetical protein AAFZ52_02580 [Bacteroidota bacterium]
MTTTTLLFKSLLVVAILVGFAHLFARPLQANQTEVPKVAAAKEQAAKPQDDSSPTDYILGKWKVKYDSDEFTGAVIYDLKKEGDTFSAYTFRYEDERGDSQKAEGTKTLVIQDFDGDKGKGFYVLEHEGEKYEVPCQIAVVDENTFKVSYDYYGYGGTETWTRL